MRIVVFSDSHGLRQPMERVIAQQKEAKLFIHLGDGLEEFKELMAHYPNREYWCVRGNCDFGAAEELTISSWVKDVKLLLTHGHHWSVKYGLEDLKEEARRRQARLLLYGHTHVAQSAYEDGLFILNPGSISRPKDLLGRPSYGTIDLCGKNIVCNIVRVED